MIAAFCPLARVRAGIGVQRARLQRSRWPRPSRDPMLFPPMKRLLPLLLIFGVGLVRIPSRKRPGFVFRRRSSLSRVCPSAGGRSRGDQAARFPFHHDRSPWNRARRRTLSAAQGYLRHEVHQATLPDFRDSLRRISVSISAPGPTPMIITRRLSAICWSIVPRDDATRERQAVNTRGSCLGSAEDRRSTRLIRVRLAGREEFSRPLSGGEFPGGHA